MFVWVELSLHDYPLLFKLWSMSHIFLQKDNITILGDIYEYPINKMKGLEIESTIIQKALMLQIILVINWKQKIARVNYDLDENYELITYYPWNDLTEFINAIGYDISDLSLRNEIYKAKEDNLPYNEQEKL